MHTLKPVRIVVVDDDEAHRFTMRLALEHEGFEVKTAATGKEALRAAEDLPDLMIVDLRLPDISGFEICRYVKTTSELASIAIVNITAAYAGSEERVEALNAGADGYLTRPATREVLLATIKSVLAARRKSR